MNGGLLPACQQCGSPAKVKYCSRACAAIVNNKLTPKRKPEGSCKVCGIPVKTVQRYCSPDCKDQWKKQQLAKRTAASIKRISEFRKKLKRKIVEYLGGQCIRCGYNKCVAALEAHHIDPLKKSFGLANKGFTKGWEKIRQEAEKCVLLCANCHREEHWLKHNPAL